MKLLKKAAESESLQENKDIMSLLIWRSLIIMPLCRVTVPNTLKEARMSPNAKEWQDAMSTVILEGNQGASATAKNPQPLTIQKFEYLNCHCFLSNMVKKICKQSKRS